MKAIFLRGLAITFILFAAAAQALSAEIIQKQEVLYAKCLEILVQSGDKIPVDPIVKKDEDNLRTIEFQMSDGILALTCDGQNNELIVETY